MHKGYLCQHMVGGIEKNICHIYQDAVSQCIENIKDENKRVR